MPRRLSIPYYLTKPLLTLRKNLLQFLKGCIERNRSLYLGELRVEVNRRYDLNVSTSTIWRALDEMGYSRKKVRPTK